MVAATLDPDGRRVVLDDHSWDHIKRKHPILTPRLREIMATVREPERRMPSRSADEVWFLAERRGRFRWLVVVVHYEGGEGWIVTAFPRASLRRS